MSIRPSTVADNQSRQKILTEFSGVCRLSQMIAHAFLCMLQPSNRKLYEPIVHKLTFLIFGPKIWRNRQKKSGKIRENAQSTPFIETGLIPHKEKRLIEKLAHKITINLHNLPLPMPSSSPLRRYQGAKSLLSERKDMCEASTPWNWSKHSNNESTTCMVIDA